MTDQASVAPSGESRKFIRNGKTYEMGLPVKPKSEPEPEPTPDLFEQQQEATSRPRTRGSITISIQ